MQWLCIKPYTVLLQSMNSAVNAEQSQAGLLGTLGHCKHLRASLSTIPDEIVEQIADNFRDDDIGDESYAECYLSDNCTDFAFSRFDLSSFSKVCKSVRYPAERALYRDIHVHFDGWDEMDDSAHPEWRGGSLRLLLRTLDGRIDLRKSVRSVQMDWHNEIHCSEEEDSSHFQDALRQFFSHCPSVRRLNVMTFPTQIFSEIAPLSQLTTFATDIPSLDMFHTVVKTFPALQDLYIVLSCRFDPPPTQFHHQLKKLHLESICIRSMFWALELCAHITEELRVTTSESGYYPGQPLTLLNLTLSPSAGTNLRSLWLKNDGFNILAYPNSSVAQAIRQLPSLRHLHMSRCLSFHPAAFSILPSSLRCLHLSEYGEWSDHRFSRHVFIVGLSRCLAQSLREIEMVVIHGWTEEALQRQIMGDLTPLKMVCDQRNIPFHLDIGSNDEWLGNGSEIRIIFT